MASIMGTSAWPHHTTLRGIDIIVFDEWEQRPRKGRDIFNVRDSTQYQEDTKTAGGAGVMTEISEGQSLSYVSLNEGFRNTFTHLDYGNGMRITRRMFREDLYGTMEEQAAELGRMAVATEETLLANHFINGFDSNFTGPDGVELFSTAHNREDGSTYSNTLTNAADLSQTSFEQAMIDFSDFRDGGGKRLMIEPALLLVSKELRFEAHRYLKSAYSPEDDTNASNPLQDIVQACVWNYLTDTDAWFLVARKEDHFLLLYERETPWTDYEVEFESKDHKTSLMFSQSSGWADPRGVFGSPGV